MSGHGDDHCYIVIDTAIDLTGPNILGAIANSAINPTELSVSST